MNGFQSVIICTYNRELYLKESLNCIALQNLDKKLFELIVINNNSTDKTDSICKVFETENPTLNFKYFIEKKAGLSFARNRAIKESNGEILIFLDDDAMATETYLSEIHAYFKKHQSTVAGGGKIIPEYENRSPDWMSSYLLPLVSAINLGDTERDFPKQKYPIGANMFFRKRFFEEHGDFKTDLGRKGTLLLGGEEKDIFQRINLKKDSIVYLPGALVRHIVPEERLKLSYIINLAKGVGISERIRVVSKGGSIAAMYLKELYKWVGSIVLFFLFFIKFENNKGKMIIRFRYFVTKGMFIGKKYIAENS